MKIKLCIALYIITLLGCKQAKDDVYLRVNEIIITYTMPKSIEENQIIYPDKRKTDFPILSDGSNKKFKSNVFFGVNLSIINNSKKSISQTLNDLMVEIPSFNLDVILKNRKIRFYNYPFSGNELFAKNDFRLNPGEVINFELESPIFFIRKNLTLLNLIQ